MKYLLIIMLPFLFGCDKETINSEKEKATIRSSYYLSTVLHDEHLFISGRCGYFIHHPDCPCQKKEQPTLAPVVENVPSVLVR